MFQTTNQVRQLVSSQLPYFMGIPIFTATYHASIYHIVKLVIVKLVGGWAYPSEKYEFVSWDYCSRYMEKMFQTTNV